MRTNRRGQNEKIRWSVQQPVDIENFGRRMGERPDDYTHDLMGRLPTTQTKSHLLNSVILIDHPIPLTVLNTIFVVR